MRITTWMALTAGRARDADRYAGLLRDRILVALRLDATVDVQECGCI